MPITMNKLMFVAIYAAIVTVALAWRQGPVIAFGLAPVASSLAAFFVALAANLVPHAVSSRAKIDGFATERT